MEEEKLSEEPREEPRDEERLSTFLAFLAFLSSCLRCLIRRAVSSSDIERFDSNDCARPSPHHHR